MQAQTATENAFEPLKLPPTLELNCDTWVWVFNTGYDLEIVPVRGGYRLTIYSNGRRRAFLYEGELNDLCNAIERGYVAPVEPEYDLFTEPCD